MSHFAVLVIGDDIDNQLAPYDENRQMVPYREDLEPDTLDRAKRHHEERWTEYDSWVASGQPVLDADPKDNDAYWRQRGITEVLEGRVPPRGSSDLDLLKWFADDTADIDDSGVAFHMSTYNPDSKWDWWVIGGRWAGMLPLKPGVHRNADPNWRLRR